MKVGLIDLDNKNSKKVFPNIPLMKLSAYHKSIGDEVLWYDDSHFDLVYVSKVFSFSNDAGIIDADKVVFGGSGFAISITDGQEVYDKTKDNPLPEDVERMFPDYSIYGITDTAYGFITKGCPRQCKFCHVGSMQGTVSHKVHELSDFWNGQKNIVLLDPNITAYKDWKNVFQQLIDTKSQIFFSQGLDIRLMTEEKIRMLMQMKVKDVHFAWDRYEDGDIIKPKLQEIQRITGWNRAKISVYVLCNYDTTIEQDLERIMFIRSLGFQPYVMRYDKEHIKRGSEINNLARWVNFVQLFWKYSTYEEYKLKNRKEK